MKIFKELTEINNVCVGLGFFDGVHLGHQILIKELVKKSNEQNKNSLIITFKKSPAEKFYDDVKYITLNDEKEKLFENLGLDYLFELDFNDNIMDMSAETYIKEVLYKYFHPTYIFSGFNHTFGKNKSGNAEVLKKYQDKYNYIYEEIPPCKYEDEVVSSTLIRKYLEKGNTEKGNALLGHKFVISGEVIEGNKLGRTIGFPTANINYPENKIKLPFGAYCADVKVGDDNYKGLLNYGIKPTIKDGKNKPVAEVHILGFNNDIYGQNIKIFVNYKIRDEKKFNSLEELKQQIKRDMDKC